MEPIKDSAVTLGEIVKGIMEEAPIYDDAIQPTAQALGQGFGGLLLYIMQPLIMMGFAAKANIEKFKTESENGLSKIPKENLIAPDPVIAGPIIQSLGYSVHHEHLRNMFTNLLVSASDSRMSSLAHPSYVEIIKQLSPDESLILKYFSTSDIHRFPVINLILGINGGYLTVNSKFNLLPEKAGCESNQKHQEILENFERLGLVTATVGELSPSMQGTETYEEAIMKSKLEIDPNLEVIAGEGIGSPIVDGKYYVQKGIIEVTRFGMQFLETCVK